MDRETLRADSPTGPGARLVLPNTKLVFVYSTSDCNGFVPIGLSFANAVAGAGPSDLIFVPNSQHALPQIDTGAAEILKAITRDCVPRH
jgi:hypothetical protein